MLKVTSWGGSKSNPPSVWLGCILDTFQGRCFGEMFKQEKVLMYGKSLKRFRVGGLDLYFGYSPQTLDKQKLINEWSFYPRFYFCATKCPITRHGYDIFLRHIMTNQSRWQFVYLILFQLLDTHNAARKITNETTHWGKEMSAASSELSCKDVFFFYGLKLAGCKTLIVVVNL